MTDYRNKLRRLAAQPAWKRLVFMTVVNALLAWKTVSEFYAYINACFPYFTRRFRLRKIPRPLAHWVVAPRPDRVATMLFAAAVLAGFFILDAHIDKLYWVIGWGSLLSIIVTFKSLSMIVQRLPRRERRSQRQ